MDAVIPNVAHLLLQYGVSMECYHEITQIISGSKSYKVTFLLMCTHKRTFKSSTSITKANKTFKLKVLTMHAGSCRIVSKQRFTCQ